MFTARRSFYFAWIILALNLHYGWVPGICDLLEMNVADLGAGYTIIVWHLYTYFVMVYSGWFIGHNLQKSAEIVARSNITAVFAAAVVLLGIIALIDIAAAYATGSDHLFLLQVLYDVVKVPPSASDLINQSLSSSVNESALTVLSSQEVVNQTVNVSF